MSFYKIAFMGTPDFSVPPLKALIEAGHYIKVVYSQPPRPAGRGEDIRQSPVHKFADSYHIPVLTPVSLKSEEVQQEFQRHEIDLAIVVAYGLLLPKIILETPPLGCLNIHASLLPRWRGASPIQRAIEAGDKESGITIMKMDEGMDTGDILLKQAIPLSSSMTAVELHETLSHLGAKMILEVLDKLSHQDIFSLPQPSEGVTYAPKLSRAEAEINWHDDAILLERKIRAFTPWPGVYFIHEGKRIKILSAELISSLGETPGKILDTSLGIACGKGGLRIISLQKEGKNPMNTHEFLKGSSLKKGMILASCNATN